MRHRLMLAAAILMWSAGPASADSITVTRGDASWHAFEAASTSGSAFWNNWSFDDNHACNVGHWLSGTGGCAARSGAFLATSPLLAPNYLGDASTGFSLTRSAHTVRIVVTNLMGVTAWDGLDELGWFDTDDPSALYPLFSGLGTIGARAEFVPSASYGFYLKSPEGTYLSTGAGDTVTHFALFELSPGWRYLLGAEDMWWGSDRDFNDAIFDVQVVHSPEPGSLILLGSGIAGLAAAARRRLRR